MNIQEETLGAAWVNYMRHVLLHGRSVPDDREEIRESESVTVEIRNPCPEDRIIRAHADPHVIEIYTLKMFSLEIIEELNSTYGDRIFANGGVDQFEWLRARLRKKWWTKGAVISLLKPDDPGPRIPCLTQIQFVVRGNVLNIFGIFRSQNVFRSYGNFIGLRELQKSMAEASGKTLGKVSAYCVCPHIYVSDIPKAEELVRKYARRKGSGVAATQREVVDNRA